MAPTYHDVRDCPRDRESEGQRKVASFLGKFRILASKWDAEIASMAIGSFKHCGKQVEKLMEGYDKLFNEIDDVDLLNTIFIEYPDPEGGPPIRKEMKCMLL